MKKPPLHHLVAVTALAAAQLCASAHAEPGVTTGEIRIGQSAAMSGGPAEEVRQATDSARLYFDSVNRSGGVFGRKIVLTSLDDGFEPKRTLANTRKLIEETDAFALFLYRGTPTVEAVMPMIKAAGIPLVAPITGATSMHEPMSRYVFNVRSKYRDEVAALTKQVAAMGMQRLAVACPTDSFGDDVLTGMTRAASERQLPPPTIARFERSTTSMAATVAPIIAANPQAVFMFCTGKPCEAFLREYRRQGGFQPVFTLSNMSSKSFVRNLGDVARGLGITQVFPSPRDTTVPLVKEFREMVKGQPALVDSYAALEGYVSAKVLVEGLRRSGKNLTREGFVATMETLKGADLGGLPLHYSPTSRDGLAFVELTVVGKDGSLMR